MQDTARTYHEQFSSMKPEDILDLLLKTHRDKVVFSTSMGAEDQVLTHMLCALTKEPSIFTLDTGRLFYETYDLVHKTNERYGISIRVLFPDRERVEEMVRSRGVNLFYHSVENRKLCCHIRKIEPLRRALKRCDIWLTGLRREQSPTRKDLAYAQWDEENAVIKVNPMLDWTEDQVWAYIKAHAVPYNTLHDKGFPSLGCQPCTREVKPGEDVRAGRWWWEQPETKECGLHRGQG